MNSEQPQFFDAQYYLHLVEKNPISYGGVPKKYQSQKLCKLALSLLGYQNSAEAIKDKPEMFYFVHPSLLDHECILSFVQSSLFRWLCQCRMVSKPVWKENETIEIEGKKIPLAKFVISYDICSELVKISSDFLRCIPPVFRKEELYELAVNSNSYALYYTPCEYKTKKICMIAYQINHHSFEYFPDEFKTQELCQEIVSENCLMLEYVPDSAKTAEMCREAVARNGFCIKYVPERIVDEELALEAIRNMPEEKNHWILDIIPSKYRTHDVCLAAVKKDPRNILRVPSDVKDSEICWAVINVGLPVGDCSHLFSEDTFPHDCYTPDFCLALIQTDIAFFKYIPKDCLSGELCLEAVKHPISPGSTVIWDIPSQFLTQEICDTAFETSSRSFGGIPDQFVTEKMILYLAEHYPPALSTRLPERFNNSEFIQKIIQTIPEGKGRYHDSLLFHWYMKLNSPNNSTKQ